MIEHPYRTLLKEKVDLLVEYKSLTEQVRSGLNQKNGRDPAVCMKARGRLINKINTIDRKLMPNGSYVHPAADKDGKNGADAAVFNDMKALLEEISEIEDECYRSAKTEWEGIKKDILAARHHRDRTKGYRHAPAAPARFVDTRIK